MNTVSPAPDELDALLRLLDDETPEVRKLVTERLALCGGDISEWLASSPRQLSGQEKRLLSEFLRPPRRENLARDWIAPTGGAGALEEDWESFEAILRALSDFLHDGISLRLPLSDALDLLSDEASESGVTSANELRSFLFKGERLIGNLNEENAPWNADLAWCLSEGRSNPLGLCLIFMLVGHRLDFEIAGVNFPGHFMCRIHEDGYPIIIDCFNKGQLHLQSTLLESPDLTRSQRAILRQSVGPGSILLQLFDQLSESLVKAGRHEDATLIEKLRATLI